MENLMEGLLSEIERVSGIRQTYQMPELQGTGELAAHLMRLDIAMAKKAIADENIVDMISMYNKLKEWE